MQTEEEKARDTPLTALDARASEALAVPSFSHVVEESAKVSAGVTADEYGVYRATKRHDLIDKCINLVNQGGVVALVSDAATDDYFTSIIEQVENFSRSRIAHPDRPEGILALPTSGSTGTPKLVAIPAASIKRFIAWGSEYFAFTESTVSLSLSPWNFDISLLDAWAVLASGGTVVAAEPAKIHIEGYLAYLVRAYKPQFLQVVPATLEALVASSRKQSYDCVRDVALTGGVASKSLRSRATQIFPRAKFHNIYGSTEVNDCMINSMSADCFAGTETLSLGVPISECIIRIRANGQHDKMPDSLKANVGEGELLVWTPWIARGYITNGKLASLPKDSNGLYPMKDHVSLACGQVFYRGRQDRTIKIRGQRVNLDEIENAARRTELVGMAHAWVHYNDSGQEIHLAYTPFAQKNTPISGLQLRIALSRILPTFAMPNHLHPFSTQFPLNGNGKPDTVHIESIIESK